MLTLSIWHSILAKKREKKTIRKRCIVHCCANSHAAVQRQTSPPFMLNYNFPFNENVKTQHRMWPNHKRCIQIHRQRQPRACQPKGNVISHARCVSCYSQRKSKYFSFILHYFLIYFLSFTEISSQVFFFSSNFKNKKGKKRKHILMKEKCMVFFK